MRTCDLAEFVEKHKGDPHSNLAYPCWASPKHKYIYMSIPKNACTKIKLVLHQLDGYAVPEDMGQIHHRELPGHTFVPKLTDFQAAEAVEMLTSGKWFRFCFVRNPYFRLFSAYKSKIMWGDPQYEYARNEIRRANDYPLSDGQPAGIVAFRDFVRYVEETPDSERDAHWRSQTSSLTPDVIDYDFVGRFESFQEDFGRVLCQLRAPDKLIAGLSERVN